MKRYLAGLLSLALLVQCGCMHRTRPTPSNSALPASSDFVDLQPGWKVRVVFPMLRSGGYVVPSVKTQSEGSTIRIQTGDDFLGYEKAYYDVLPRRDGGIRIRFTHADVWEKNKIHTHHQTRLPLFKDAADARYIRLVYLIRVSKADHNMAIVAASDQNALDSLTQVVIQRAECNATPSATCTWVPEGVAVTPEKS